MSTSGATTPSARCQKALSLAAETHALDPQSQSAAYHASLTRFCQQLCSTSQNPTLRNGPSEALLLASNMQHIRRWERPRSDYPLGLSGYKLWRTKLNQYHAEIARNLLVEAGYSLEDDEALFGRVKDLLLKKNLARPPLPEVLKDPEMQLFEDAICLVFLASEDQFPKFANKLDDPDKMVDIVRKTWVKMTPEGQAIVASDLLPTLPQELQDLIAKALGA